jgi:hypothetical protein
MGARTLDLTILRKGRQEDKLQAFGDPDDAAFAGWLSVQLRDWLRGHKWADALWSEFEVEAREHKGWTLKGKARS